MPDIREGIETGEPQFDPNSDAGFNALVASQVAKQSGEDPDAEQLAETLLRVKEGDRSVAGGLEESPSEGELRDERGRFTAAAAQAASPKPEGAAPPEESGEGEEQDPYAEFLSRFDSPEEAARAALKEKEEAQSLIGRQGNELGELRKWQQETNERLAEMRGRMEATPPPDAFQPAPQIDYEQLETIVAGPNGDGAGGPRAWQMAAQTGDQNVLDAVLDVWKEYDPYQAALTRMRFEQGLRELNAQQRQPQEAAQPDPVLADIRAERQIGSVVDKVKESMDPKDWAVIKDHLVDTLTDEKTPDLVKNAVASGDPSAQEQGMRALAELAKGRVVAVALSKQRQQQETDEAKRKTAIGTGSLRPAAAAPAGGDVSNLSKEDRHAMFVKKILESETTDVRAGLTYGPTQ